MVSPEIYFRINDDDVLIINADHGNDPTYKGTDHTREYIPVLVYGKNIKSGIVIADVSSGSGAANAGLKKGDIITKIDDITVKDHAYLRYELYQHQAGDKIKLTIIRAGKEKTVEVTLGK